jgi:chloride channel protein, CIC family
MATIPQKQDLAIAEETALRRFLSGREDQVFLVLTLLIGALVGLIVVAFILSTERVGQRLYPADGAAWHRVAFPIIVSLVMGFLLYRYFPNARGSGVPQSKAALYAREGRISLRTVFGKFFCTSATLASGIPLGREGPSVQVGAGIASVLGRKLGLRQEKVKALIPVGAAAAVAAAFNTPLAAVLFSLEEVVGGLVSAAFTRLLLWLRERFLAGPRKALWFQPVAGGLIVGLMGWFVPQTLGVAMLTSAKL